MSILDMGAADTAAALPEYVAPPKPEPKFSAWSAVFRGVAEAGAQVAATGSDVWGALKYMRDTPTKDMPAGVPASEFRSDMGDKLRDWGRELRPDAESASAAEQVLYGFSRGASKVVVGALAGGIPGVIAAGVEEGVTQSEELKRQGVDPDARSKAGIVQGAGLMLAALPAVGTTLKGTAALYAAGGPGGFMAQQALTREILRDAGQDKIAEQFDPFDPVGLAVSTLLPAGFAAWGIRGQRIAAAQKAAEDFRTGPVPSAETNTATAVREAYSPEVVDAARVAYAVEQRQASNPAGMDLQTMDAHEAALTKAADQMARGEPVQVADTLPEFEDARLTDFRAALDELTATRQPEPAPMMPTQQPAPEPAKGNPRNLQAEMIALRKETTVLTKLMGCLDG